MNGLRAVIALCILVCIGALTLLYRPHLSVSQRQHHAAEASPRPATQSVGEVQRRLHAVIEATPLGKIEPLSDESTDRDDATGNWTVRHLTWRVPADRSPSALARRIEMLMAEGRDPPTIYVTRPAELQFEVRVYAGARLAATILLKPTLDRWPKLMKGRAPLLGVILVVAPGQARSVRAWLEQSHPFAMALPPFDAFSLRLAHDAIIQRKEVLVTLDRGDDAKANLGAIPHITGALILEHPAGLPHQLASLLSDRDLIVLDPDGLRLPTAWRTTLRESNLTVLAADLLDELGEVDDVLTRHHHRAVTEGGSILLASATDEIAPLVLADLAEAARRGYRPAFLPEIIHRLENGRVP